VFASSWRPASAILRCSILAIDSKLRGCDLVRVKIDDVCAGGRVRDRATVIQKKTGRPVQFEITEQTRSAIGEWLAAFDARRGRNLFPSRFRQKPHLSTRHYARIVRRWMERAGPDSPAHGTPPLRRTKPAQIYRKAGNLRAIQLHGHTKLESTVRYLGVELDDALAISEQGELQARAKHARFWRIRGPRCIECRVACAPNPTFFLREFLALSPMVTTDGQGRGVVANARQPLGARPGSTY